MKKMPIKDALALNISWEDEKGEKVAPLEATYKVEEIIDFTGRMIRKVITRVDLTKHHREAIGPGLEEKSLQRCM